MKLYGKRYDRAGWDVAPHVGAWIETVFAGCRPLPGFVAPHVGAWIETSLRGPVAR